MLKKLFVLALLFVGGIVVIAQAEETACTSMLQDVLTNIPEICHTTGRNQVCYGHASILAETSDHAQGFAFSEPGDVEDISAFKTLRLGAMNLENDEWGIALFKIQANLPDTIPGQNVTLLMFGDTHIKSAYIPVELSGTVTADQTVNMRQLPTTGSSVVGAVSPDEAVTVNGVDKTGDWYRVALADGQQGWIADFLLSVEGDAGTLNIVSDSDSVYGAMQALYLESGIGDRPCHDVPDSGLLIQTPKGTRQIHFMINEVSIVVGSTLYVQATAGGSLFIYVLEGQVEVTAFDVTQVVPEGVFVTVPINADLQATGAPDDIQHYDEMDFEALPISLLPDPIEIADPLTEDDLAELEQCTGINESVINMRGGPGIGYGSTRLNAGETSTITGKVDGTDGFVWYQVEGNQWIRSDLLILSGDCSGVPTITDIPVLPTAIPVAQSNNSGTTGSSGNNYYNLHFCESRRGLQVGQTISFAVGTGRWETPEIAASNLASMSAQITVDGQSASNIWYARIQLYKGHGAPDGYGQVASGSWLATSGTHTAVGQWTNDIAWNCTFTVP